MKRPSLFLPDENLSESPDKRIRQTRLDNDPDRLCSALFYAALAGIAFALWREDAWAGIFVFATLWPLNLAISS